LARRGDQRQCRDTPDGAFLIIVLPRLRPLYPVPRERAWRKLLGALGRQALRAVRRSPFVLLPLRRRAR
jgi:hypothetical protein